MSRLHAESVTVGYEASPVLHDLTIAIPDGQITTIIGPNGCGKSTLLRTLARLHQPDHGAVLLDGQLIHRLPTREVARRLGLLPQQTLPPAGMTVEDLVRRGRYPHQSFMQSPTASDAAAIEHTLRLTGVADLRHRQMDELSGGQRQRAWLAMTLAQDTPLILLDEPATYLDLAHQIDVIDLIRRLNEEDGRTIVMVLHDVNEAARVSHHLVAIRDGRILRQGSPAELMESHLLSELYGIPCAVHRDEPGGQAIYVPRSATAPNAGAASSAAAPSMAIDCLTCGYADCPILRQLSLAIPAGKITAIIGPNACGKSTLLRTCACLLKPDSGAVRIGPKDIHKESRRRRARRLALLAQALVPPAGFVVEDLVSLGRLPHQSLLRQWRAEDEATVSGAIDRCGIRELAQREAETLSGGQRQRAFFAMVLAQETPMLLLDEPTTFLDPAAQVELLDLAFALNREQGTTVVMVLHDVSLAARYADWLVAMRDGQVVAAGTPADVVRPALLRDVFGIDAAVMPDPATGAPLVLPQHRPSMATPVLAG